MAGTPLNDGNVSFIGGQHDGLPPDLIRDDQFQRGINLTTRNGRLGPRWGYVQKKVTVTTEGGIDSLSYKRIFKRGKFQGGRAYDTESGTFILAVISGVIFRIDPRSFEADVVFLKDGDRMNQYRRQIPSSEAGRFVVFYDYPNLPVIVENNQARRSDLSRESIPGVALPEIPTSVLGAYVQGRLHVANKKHEFLSGDPVGGINEDAPITFEESLAPAGSFNGKSVSLGTQSGNQPITAMGFLQVADTSTGVGPLIVATKGSVYTFRVDLPREDWEKEAFGRLILYNAGIAGPNAISNQNSDVIFLSGDNQVRSLLFGTREQQRWSNAPISREISPWLEEFKKPELLDLGFVRSYRNKVFVSVAPYTTESLDTKGRKVFSHAHGGMVVLELDNVSSLGDDAPPVWAGLWTGISPMAMMVLDEGPYVFSKDDNGANQLYFLDRELTYDVHDEKDKNIVSRVYTREYDFQSPFVDKQVGGVSYIVSGVEGLFDLEAKYRGSHLSRWALWRHFQHNAQTEIKDAGAESGPLPLLESHSFRELHFGDPEERECDELTQDEGTVLRKVALRLTLSAKNWSLDAIKLRFFALEEQDRPATDTCDKVEEKQVFGKFEMNDWEFYRTAPAAIWV